MLLRLFVLDLLLVVLSPYPRAVGRTTRKQQQTAVRVLDDLRARNDGTTKTHSSTQSARKRVPPRNNTVNPRIDGRPRGRTLYGRIIPLFPRNAAEEMLSPCSSRYRRYAYKNEEIRVGIFSRRDSRQPSLEFHLLLTTQMYE